MQPLSTQLIRRLRAGEQTAWFELWDVFGPAIQSTIRRFGRQQFSLETVRDMTQETLGEVAKQIDKFDPGRGVDTRAQVYRPRKPGSYRRRHSLSL